MSTLNSSVMETHLQNAINSVTTSTSFTDIFHLCTAIGGYGDYKSTVANINLLPDLTLGATQAGTIVYVESIGQPVVAGNNIWFGLDGKPIRYDSSGQLWTWGNNNYGQLGNGTAGANTSISSPYTTAGGGTNWMQVSVGNGNNESAIKTDGTLWTFGSNGSGQLGTGDTTHRSSPVTTAGGGTNWSMVCSGSTHRTAIKTDGTLWTWGANFNGQLGDGTITNRSSPGTTAGGGTNWSYICGKGTHTAAIKTDGTLWTWGSNTYGQLGDGTATHRSSPVTTAGGGTNWNNVDALLFTMAIKTDGTLWTWGYNAYGSLGNNTAGAGTSISSPGTTAGGGINWSQVSCGTYHAAAIKTDGTLWIWGNGPFGALGNGIDTLDKSSPVTTAGGGTNWSQVSAGWYTTAAVKTDGKLWIWGNNTYGQLGNGTTTHQLSPVTTAGGGTNWSMVSSGYRHTAAISQV